MNPRPPLEIALYRKLSWTKELNRKGRKENPQRAQRRNNQEDSFAIFAVYFASFAVTLFALPEKA
jgi:hypothetical protein